MRLVIAKPADKRLRRLQPKLGLAIVAALRVIAADPFGPHPNVKPLAGAKNAFRLRHGDWRIGYRLDRAADTMYVDWIETRGDAYR